MENIHDLIIIMIIGISVHCNKNQISIMRDGSFGQSISLDKWNEMFSFDSESRTE